MKHVTNIDHLAKQIHKQHKKSEWWSEVSPCIFTKIQLISTEVAEATEGERKDLMDDHLPERKMAEVELADAMIRVLDLGGYLKLKFVEGVTLPPDNFFNSATVGHLHLTINEMIVLLSLAYGEEAEGYANDDSLNHAYSELILTIEKVAEVCCYDIETAMFEKLEYNKIRPDHKKENREKKHGKKF